MGPFDVIDSLRKGEEWKPEFKAAYSPFLTNKYFSNDKKYLFVSLIADTIVDSEMNYKFWLGLVDKKSRRIPWIKNKKESDLLYLNAPLDSNATNATKIILDSGRV